MHRLIDARHTPACRWECERCWLSGLVPGAWYNLWPAARLSAKPGKPQNKVAARYTNCRSTERFCTLLPSRDQT